MCAGNPGFELVCNSLVAAGTLIHDCPGLSPKSPRPLGPHLLSWADTAREDSGMTLPWECPQAGSALCLGKGSFTRGSGQQHPHTPFSFPLEPPGEWSAVLRQSAVAVMLVPTLTFRFSPCALP